MNKSLLFWSGKPRSNHFLFTLIALILTFVTTVVNAQLDLKELLARDSYSEISISPNGDHLVCIYFNATTEKFELQFYDLNTRELASLIPLEKFRPSEVTWVDDRRVVLMANNALFSANIHARDISALLLGAGENDDRTFGESVFQKRLKSWIFVSKIEDQPEEVLIASLNNKGHGRLHAFNVYTGVMRDIEDGLRTKMSYWWIDANGRPFIGVRNKKRTQTFFIKKNGKWVEHDTAFKDGEIRLNRTDLQPYGADRIQRRFGQDQLTLVSQVGDNGLYKLIAYDPNKGQIIDVVHSDSRYDLDSTVAGLSTYRHKDKKLLALGFSTQRWNQITYDPIVDDAVATVRNMLPTHRVSIWSQAHDVQRYILRAFHPTIGSTYYLYDGESGDAIRLFGEEPLFDEDSPSIEFVRITAKDGTELDGYLWLPPASAPRGPLMLAFKQTRSNRVFAYLDADLMYLASRGYRILQINPRGVVGYGREFMLAGMRDAQTLMSSDLHSAAQWLKQQPGHETLPLLGFGWNSGAHALLLTNARYPDLFNAIATFGAPLDLNELIEYWEDEDRDNDIDWIEQFAEPGVPLEKTLATMSPASYLDSWNTPTLLSHGRANGFVPIEQLEEFMVKARSSGKPIKDRVLNSSGYRFYGAGERQRFLTMVTRFYERYAPLPEPQSTPATEHNNGSVAALER